MTRTMKVSRSCIKIHHVPTLNDPLSNESVKWWKVIHHAMSNPDSEYNNLLATLEQFEGHDPANISPNPLSSAQLLEMFEKIRDQYTVTYARWDKSGEHNPNFWDYCWTQQRAGLLQFVSKQAELCSLCTSATLWGIVVV